MGILRCPRRSSNDFLHVPLSVGNVFETLPLDCPALHITASVIELYDAGWCIESVNIGHDTRENGAAEMPLTVTLRKLF